MMEFTLSRTAMCLCAVLLMAAVAGPVNGLLEDRESEMYAGSGASLAGVMDAFGEGEADSMILDLALYLPSGSSVGFEGNRMTMETSEGVYTYFMHTDVVCDGSFGCGELVELTKTGGSVSVGRL